MTCDQARRLIDRYELDELSPRESRLLSEHVQGCAACSAELGGITRLVTLIRGLPEPEPTSDLDARILAASLADRQRRHEQRSWLGELPRQILRGALRTTGTVMVTVVALSLVGGTFVYAAASFFAGQPLFVGTAEPTPTPTPSTTIVVVEPTPLVIIVTPAPTEAPATATAAPTAPVTPAPTPVVTPEPSPEPTPEPTASPSPSDTVEPTPAPTASPTVKPTAEPTPEPTPDPTPVPSPTDKRRTPPPSPSPSPTASPSGSTSP